MKYVKRGLMLLVASVLCLSVLTGCGGQDRSRRAFR